jgi:hypothetical protein
MSEWHPGMAVIFLHIPKAAGSTLHPIIERQYEPAEIWTVDGAHVRESIETFKQLSEAERGRIRVLKGHMSFGLHRYLLRPATYVTLLREPIDRIISHYTYVRRHPAHDLHEQVVSRNMSLQDYVSSGISVELDNGQTRLLAGFEEMDAVTGFAPCVPEMLQSAKRNLENYFSVVGLAESFDAALLVLKHTLGWHHLFHIKENVAKDRLLKSELDQGTLETIREHNALDIQLYQHASTLFALQFQRHGIPGAWELGIFRMLNSLYGVASRAANLRSAMERLRR